MATIISQTNSEGTRRCDAKCHNALHEKCNCICGGRYHGSAKDGSMDDKLREDQDAIIARLEENGHRLDQLKAAIEQGRQKQLFQQGEGH